MFPHSTENSRELVGPIWAFQVAANMSALLTSNTILQSKHCLVHLF